MWINNKLDKCIRWSKSPDQPQYCSCITSLLLRPVRRCPTLFAPLHGFVTCTSDGNNYGATCEYRCDGGYELRGISSRVCLFSGDWDGEPARCEREWARSWAAHKLDPQEMRRSRLGVLAALQIKTDVKTLGALLDQFYEKRRLLILSAPNMSDPDYQLQNIMIQVRHLLVHAFH